MKEVFMFGKNSALKIVVLSLAVLNACEVSEECERSRMKVSRNYTNLMAAAQQRKLAGFDVEGWAFIENKTDLLQSAFATRQVTWASADKARQEITARLSNLNSDTSTSVEIFKQSADEAFQAQDSYARQCR